MPITHFPQEINPETHWWNQQQQMEPIAPKTHFWDTNSSFNFNLNEEDAGAGAGEEERDGPAGAGEKEHMFEKPLTPSDVGKLNRLVIPKQYAEKYFPIAGGAIAGDGAGEKGLLLNFEDECGKCWRFRYSYWNSSQSYVLTKGWSRFVKEKRLDAGDVVLFQRHRVDGDRLFIGWRRRINGSPVQDSRVAQPAAAVAGEGGWTRVYYPAYPYPARSHGPPLPYQPDLHAGSVVQSQTAPNPNAANSKRLRLFGVNMECQLDDDSEPHPKPGGSAHSKPPNHFHNHMEEVNFSGDVNNQMRRYRQG